MGNRLINLLSNWCEWWVSGYWVASMCVLVGSCQTATTVWLEPGAPWPNPVFPHLCSNPPGPTGRLSAGVNQWRWSFRGTQSELQNSCGFKSRECPRLNYCLMESGGAIIECDTSKQCALGCGSTSRSQNSTLTVISCNVHTPTTRMCNQVGGDVIKVALSRSFMWKHTCPINLKQWE